MKLVVCTVDSGEDASSFSGAITRRYEKDKTVNMGYYYNTPDNLVQLPLDGDLYVIHGKVQLDHEAMKHISPKRIIYFGHPKAGSFNAPLDSLELRVTGNYGSDHGTLTSSQIKALDERIAYVKQLPEIQYHISPDGGLAGLWSPRIPVGDSDPSQPASKTKELSKNILLTETHAPRICTSTTLLGCFYGIYPNWSEEFEKNDCKHLDFYVYVASNYDPKKFMGTEEIVDHKLVWDAHLSQECNIYGNAEMLKLAYRVRFHKPLSTPYTDRKTHNWVHPYDDVTEPEIYHSPKVHYSWINTK